VLTHALCLLTWMWEPSTEDCCFSLSDGCVNCGAVPVFRRGRLPVAVPLRLLLFLFHHHRLPVPASSSQLAILTPDAHLCRFVVFSLDGSSCTASRISDCLPHEQELMTPPLPHKKRLKTQKTAV
jgi:hypothetical protein